MMAFKAMEYIAALIPTRRAQKQIAGLYGLCLGPPCSAGPKRPYMAFVLGPVISGPPWT